MAGRATGGRPSQLVGWLKAGQAGLAGSRVPGLSQEQVARVAGVSQGAVSRFEGGRGLATPLLVVMKVNAALRSAVSSMEREVLSEDARNLLLLDERVPGWNESAPPPITKDPELEELVRLYRDLPERQRLRLLAVIRATAAALGAAIDTVRETPGRLSDAR